jgi:murein DD-endopeptidase MepM/ murein hydrolase activator NlpD
MAMIMPRAISGTAVLKFAFGAFTALLLAGCSDSIERFSDNYSNPSDQDPVYTASVHSYKRKTPATVKKWSADYSSSASDDQIAETPIAPKAPYQPKAPASDYANSYKQAYQQPAAPAAAAPAPVYTQPKYQQPKLAYKTPAAPAPADPVYDNPAPVTQPAKLAATPKLKLPPQLPADNAAQVTDDTPQVDDATAKKVTMKPGMTLYGLARTNHLTVQQLAAANNIKPPYVVPPGRVLTIPASSSTAAAKPAAPAKDDAQIADAGDQTDGNAAKSAATPMIKKPAPLALPKEPAAADVATSETPADANPQLALRWPLRGKIISGFGPKQNGLKNEGINIAVPEGTNIQAADGGVVAYAGNELKGYGNLVLIRHEGGYVTAYAHAAKLLVKKGDVVKRGAVIAVAGQTGAVQSPQLHFEVRKGATALDPQKFLASTTAMN